MHILTVPCPMPGKTAPWKQQQEYTSMGFALERLKTGEIAYQAGVSLYAAVPDTRGGDRSIRVFSRYNPSRRPAAEISVSEGFHQEGMYHDVRDAAEFAIRMQDLATHYEQEAALGHETIQSTTSTPWGRAQGGTRYTRGITRYHTAGHGGIKLSDTMNARMPDELRNPDGWYEEDCEATKVIYAFPEFFTDRQKRLALESFMSNYPDEYEALTGNEIPPGHSHVKDKRQFEADHADDWIVVSALGSSHHPGMVECIARLGGKWEEDGEERRFLVPKEEYDQGRFGFVIDLESHEEVEAVPSFRR